MHRPRTVIFGFDTHEAVVHATAVWHQRGLVAQIRELGTPYSVAVLQLDDGEPVDEDLTSYVLFDTAATIGHSTTSVDFEKDDDVAPCSHCTLWRYEYVDDETGRPVLREWHAADCPQVARWAEA